MNLSVVVPTYNCGPFIGRTLESVLCQPGPAPELIVIDDGSTDATADVLRPFLSRIVLERQSNQGVAIARNRGMDLARGEWLMFLDADDVLEEGSLGRLLAGARAGAGVVYGHATHIDVNDVVLREHRSRDCTGPVPSAARQNFGGAAFVPGCAIVRAPLAREIRFDQQYAPCEDRDFWIRCGLKAEFTEVPDVVLRYRVRPGSHSGNRERQVVQSTRVRLGALQTFADGKPPVEIGLTAADVLGQTLTDVFWQREWTIVDRLLTLAAERGIESEAIAEIRRKRRLPPWLHRLKDRADRLFAR
jgi:glycosyltransferase involved in cell wall biosynthesis